MVVFWALPLALAMPMLLVLPWLQNCLVEFKSIFAKGIYTALIPCLSIPQPKCQHKISREMEKENQISSLDTLVTKENGTLYISIYWFRN